MKPLRPQNIEAADEVFPVSSSGPRTSAHYDRFRQWEKKTQSKSRKSKQISVDKRNSEYSGDNM